MQRCGDMGACMQVTAHAACCLELELDSPAPFRRKDAACIRLSRQATGKC